MGDFYHPALTHGHTPLEVVDGSNPYNNDAVTVRYHRKGVGQPYKREHHVTVFHKEDQHLNFDPREDYLAGGLLQREEIRAAFKGVKKLSTQPGALWKGEDFFDKQSGSIRHSEKLVIAGAVVFEHVTLSIHPHQHLIDAGRTGLAKQAKALQDAEPTDANRRALSRIWEALNKPIKLGAA
jgi:hypothetical protein